MATNDIVLSAASRSNLLSLQSTQKLIDITQLRLATGKKVNSALDNPQSFFQSQALSNRAGDLTKLLDGIGQSIRTIEEADKGISALTKLVEQASSVADQARSEALAAEGFATVTGTTNIGQFDDLVADSGGTIANGDDIRFTFFHADVNSGAPVNVDINIANGDTIYDIVGTINSTTALQGNLRASVDTQGRLKLESLREGGMIRIGDVPAATSLGTDGYAFLGLASVVTTEDTVATTRQAGTIVAGRTITSKVSAAGTVNGEYEAGATLNAANFIQNFGTAGTDAARISLRVDNDTVVLGDYVDTTTIQVLIDDINNSSLGDRVTASFNVDTGRIELAFGENVAQAEITIESDVADAGDVAFGFGTGITGYGTLGGATDVTLAAGDAHGEAFTFVGSSANLVQYRDDYNTIRDQIDSLVEDANYRGVNLLGGDNLTTYFNEDRDNTLVTEGVDFSASGLGLAEVDFLDAGDVTAAINATQNALETIRAFGSSVANDLAIIQARQVFTQETINTLKAGAADLVNADLNEEGANLLALQTAQQLGVTSLSLASQSQQSVLRLF